MRGESALFVRGESRTSGARTAARSDAIANEFASKAASERWNSSVSFKLVIGFHAPNEIAF